MSLMKNSKQFNYTRSTCSAVFAIYPYGYNVFFFFHSVAR